MSPTRHSLGFAAVLLALAIFTGCESTDGGSSSSSVGVYYGVGFYDPWYYGDYDHDTDVDITLPDRPDRPDRPVNPDRPDRPGRPEQPIERPPEVSARPSPAYERPAARPMPSIPSTPRPVARPAGRR